MALFRQRHAIETYKGVLRLGLFTLKVLFLLNGGSLVGLLAYLGNSDIVPDPQIIEPIGILLGGVVLAVFATVLAYFMERKLFEESRDALYGARNPARHSILLWCAVVCAVLSLAAFAAGAIYAALLLLETGSDGGPSSAPLAV